MSPLGKRLILLALIIVSCVLGLLLWATTGLLVTRAVYKQAQATRIAATATAGATMSPGVPPGGRKAHLYASGEVEAIATATDTITMPPGTPAEELFATPTTSPGQPTTTPPPPSTFDANFRPDRDGFGFRNYGSRFPAGNLTIVEVRALFGPSVCAGASDQTCTPSPAAQLWIKRMNDDMAPSHAAGFTIASYRFFDKQLQPADFGATVTFDIKRDVPIMRQIAKAQVSVLQLTEEVQQDRGAGSPAEVLDELGKLGEPVNLNIKSRTGGSHSLLAYAVEDKGNSIYHIRVYDSNWPGRDLSVKVDYRANTWYYSHAKARPEGDIETWAGDATTKSLTFIPFSAYDQPEPVTCPFCERRAGGPIAVALRGKEGLLQVTDAAGNLIGQEPPLEVPPQQLHFTARIRPQPAIEIANTALRADGPGFTLVVDGLDLAAGQVAEITVWPDDQQVIYSANGPTNPALKMAIEKNGRSTLVIVADTALEADEKLRLTLDPQGDRASIGRSGAGPGAQPTTAIVIMAVLEPDRQPLLFAGPALPLPQAGAAALDITGWDGTGPLAVNLDRNGDGRYEELRTVENVLLADLLGDQPTARKILELLGELGPYLAEAQSEALLARLTDLGKRGSSPVTCTGLLLDGDDLGKVLFGLDYQDLSPEALAKFMAELDLQPDELAHLIFQLKLSQRKEDALIAALDLLAAKEEIVRAELDKIKAADDLLKEWWESGDQSLTGLAEFIDRQGMTAADIGFMLDELDLELEELIEVLLATDPSLSSADLSTIFCELNLTAQEQQEILERFGRGPKDEPIPTPIPPNGPPNHPPVARDDAYTTLEDQQLDERKPGVLRNDRDPDGDQLTAILDGNVTSGTLNLATDGSFSYNPNEDFNGRDSFTYHANDGEADSNIVTASIIITPVNDAPSFTMITKTHTVTEDAGPVSVLSWTTSISEGAYNEINQTLTFSVTTDNDNLFSVKPQIEPTNGTLTYTPAPDANGTATVSVILKDNGAGGTPNGDINTSPPQTFTITVNPVNDPPTFTISSTNHTVLEEAGPVSVPDWATNISPGPPDEINQTLTFIVTTDNDSLFSVKPQIEPTNGTLTYTPAPDANGTATVTVILTDNGGTANGGIDTSPPQTFTITVIPVNDPPSFTSTPLTSATVGLVYTYNIVATDVDGGDVLTISAPTLPGWLTLTPTGNGTATLTGTPTVTDTGANPISLLVQDSGGLTDTQVFTLVVAP